jgi:hypothetical protein
MLDLLINIMLTYFTCYVRLGCEDFTHPIYKPTPNDGASRSLFFPDEAIFQGHPRFRTLTRNIRERRGEKVSINLPGTCLSLLLLVLYVIKKQYILYYVIFHNLIILFASNQSEFLTTKLYISYNNYLYNLL